MDVIYTSTEAGSQYFLVEAKSPSVGNAWEKDYFLGAIAYQASHLLRHLAGESKKSAADFSAPNVQISPVLALRCKAYIKALEPFAYLGENWCGRGSHGPTTMHLWQAAIDGCKLIAIGLPVPKVKILDEGTLGVYWRNGPSYATIDYEPDGIHVWAITDGQTYKSGTWDAEAEVVPFVKNGLLTTDPSGQVRALPSNI